jgi:hypothetical protein
MNDITQFTAAIESQAWPVVVGFALLALVYVARHPAAALQWYRIPAGYRPWLPIAIGIVSGVAEALTTGRAWLPAMLTALAAAIPAMLAALPSPVVPGKTVIVEVEKE